MSSSRYMIIDRNDLRGDEVVMSGSEARHLTRVLRARKGDSVFLLDGAGTVYTAEFRENKEEGISLGVLSKEDHPRLPAVDIAIGILKPARMEMAVEKCTELGVRRIIPFSCERSIWRNEDGSRARKHERLRRKVESACKQCGQPWFPQVVEPVSLQELVGLSTDYSYATVALQGASRRARAELEAGPALGIVGPEGGFTDDEEALLEKAGIEPSSLGGLRLRSETAAICMVFSMLTAAQTAD